MNDLSWMIYAADVADGLSTFTLFAGFVAFACFVTKAIARADGECTSTPVALFGVASAILWLMCAAIPAKETVYAIAASEMGEEVAQSETAGKAIKALNAWLDKQIATASE